MSGLPPRVHFGHGSRPHLRLLPQLLRGIGPQRGNHHRVGKLRDTCVGAAVVVRNVDAGRSKTVAQLIAGMPPRSLDHLLEGINHVLAAPGRAQPRFETVSQVFPGVFPRQPHQIFHPGGLLLLMLPHLLSAPRRKSGHRRPLLRLGLSRQLIGGGGVELALFHQLLAFGDEPRVGGVHPAHLVAAHPQHLGHILAQIFGHLLSGGPPRLQNLPQLCLLPVQVGGGHLPVVGVGHQQHGLFLQVVQHRHLIGRDALEPLVLLRQQPVGAQPPVPVHAAVSAVAAPHHPHRVQQPYRADVLRQSGNALDGIEILPVVLNQMDGNAVQCISHFETSQSLCGCPPQRIPCSRSARSK